jgi:hypothetical protein
MFRGTGSLLSSNVVHTNITIGDYKVEKETEYEAGKTVTEEELEDAGDKIKAGVKAVFQ